jgi:hypothetical protein
MTAVPMSSRRPLNGPRVKRRIALRDIMWANAPACDL